MPEKDPKTGQFVKAEAQAEEAPKPKLVHPALRPRKHLPKASMKQRRTTVRTAKLLSIEYREDGDGETYEYITLREVPIEPHHNNRGTLSDPTTPIRHYLDKGFVWPHEYDAKKYPGIYCAVSRCWKWATVSDDADYGTERCTEHEQMWREGTIRYATHARGPR